MDKISEEAKRTATHIGFISQGAIQTLIDEIRQEERERIKGIIEKSRTIDERFGVGIKEEQTRQQIIADLFFQTIDKK